MSTGVEARLKIGDPNEIPPSGNVKALARKFEERRENLVTSATLPLPKNKSSVSAVVKRRISSKNSASANQNNSKNNHRPAVSLYKNRAGVSRRKSAVKKASSAHDIRAMKRSPLRTDFPKSKSAQERLNSATSIRSSSPPRTSTPTKNGTPSNIRDIFDISSQKLSRPKPKTPPKPSFLVLDRKTKTVSISPEYAEYDTWFSSQNQTSVQEENGASPEMVLNGSELEISGHIYCCLNGSTGSCTCGGNSSLDSTEFEVQNSTLTEEQPVIAELPPRNEETPTCLSEEDRKLSLPPPVGPTSALGSNKRETSPDTERYTKMAEEIFEEEEQRLRVRGEGGSMSSTSWETGSSISTQSGGDKAAKFVGFKSLSVQKEESEETTTTPKATLDFRAKKMSQSLCQESVTSSTSGDSEKLAAKRKPSKNVSKKVRPVSQPSIDFDRLLRIKSDIQLNLAKQIGKIKLRVTSSPGVTPDEKSTGRKKRAKSTFYVSGKKDSPTNEETTSNSMSSPESLAPSEVKGTWEFQLMNDEDDDHVFDDDWSDTDDISEADGVTESKRKKLNFSIRPFSVESGNCLPDVVPGKIIGVCSTDEQKSPSVPAESEIGKTENCPVTPVTSSATLDRDTVSPLSSELWAMIEQASSPMISPSLIKSLSVDQQTEGSCTENFQPTYSSRFVDNQPLYQKYHEEMDREALRVARNESMSSTDTGEEGESILGPPSSMSLSLTGSGRWCAKKSRDFFVASSNFGSQRSLWCELPEVKRAGLLDALGDQEKKLQEAMFEVITSEASYLRSLNILITHFMAAAELSGKQNLQSVVCAQERKNLFSNILKVRDCSESLLSALESNFEEDLKLYDICGLLADHFKRDFDVYVKYCSNQVYQDRTLRSLKVNNVRFAQILHDLESNPMCEGLDMRSFLMLPMQRITRYPLLVDAIYQRTQRDTERFENAGRALALANKVVVKCNEGARKMERMEQLLDIDRRLIYRNGDGLRKIPLVSSGRYLVKKEELIQLRKSQDYPTIRRGSLQEALASATPGRKKLKRLFFFLFTDLLMVAKKQHAGDNFVVRDYCARQFVEVTPVQPTSSQVPQGALAALGAYRSPHLFLITLMQNAKGKQTDLLVCAETETDRARWVEALSPPPQPANPEEAVYADWDCPQVQAIHQYVPVQEDELRLEVGEVVNVLRKMKDGWMEGERQTDGLRGWFPRTYVVEILSDHVRAKNYRQRLRLIQAAESLQRDQNNAKKMKDFAYSVENELKGERKHSGLKNQLRRLSNPKMLFQV